MACYEILESWVPLRHYSVGDIVELDENLPRWKELLPEALRSGYLEKTKKTKDTQIATPPKQRGKSRHELAAERMARKQEGYKPPNGELDAALSALETAQGEAAVLRDELEKAEKKLAADKSDKGASEKGSDKGQG